MPHIIGMHNACQQKQQQQQQQQQHLNDEDQGRYGVKDECAVPDVKVGNLAPLEDNALAQIASGHEGHIPAHDQLCCKGHTCAGHADCNI